MVPSLFVITVGMDPTRTLVISQVVLSFGLPFAVIPLIMLTRRRDVMGVLVNRRITTFLAGLFAVIIIALNSYLLYQTFLAGWVRDRAFRLPLASLKLGLRSGICADDTIRMQTDS
jgi:manganese transport protein